MKNWAFTLVELIVTMAVIAILAAMLFPSASSAIQRAQTTRCAANLHKIGIGVIQYAGENNGQLPSALSYGITTGDTMILALEPYLENKTKVWDCPSNPQLRAAGFTGYVQGNYASAFYFGHPGSGALPYTLLQINEFDRNKRWLLADMDAWNYANAIIAKAAPLPVHQKGRNVLFADGRVEWIASKPNTVP